MNVIIIQSYLEYILNIPNFDIKLTLGLCKVTCDIRWVIYREDWLNLHRHHFKRLNSQHGLSISLQPFCKMTYIPCNFLTFNFLSLWATVSPSIIWNVHKHGWVRDGAQEQTFTCQVCVLWIPKFAKKSHACFLFSVTLINYHLTCDSHLHCFPSCTLHT